MNNKRKKKEFGEREVSSSFSPRLEREASHPGGADSGQNGGGDKLSGRSQEVSKSHQV
jgi:hypothetical protein